MTNPIRQIVEKGAGSRNLLALLPACRRHSLHQARLRSVNRPLWPFTAETPMSQPESREILILGSGAASKHLARHMAAAGHRTPVIERRWIGGACHNVACLLSKNEMWSARVDGTDILVTAGRVPNTAGIGLDRARIALDERGFVASTSGWKRLPPNRDARRPLLSAPARCNDRTSVTYRRNSATGIRCGGSSDDGAHRGCRMCCCKR